MNNISEKNVKLKLTVNHFATILRARASIAIARISYGDSVMVSWFPSRPGTVASRGEIETSGFHHMIAYCI